MTLSEDNFAGVTRSRERPRVPEVLGVQSVLFVCLGNICRSPLAHGVLAHRAAERGVSDRLRIDSCGTGGWHVGSPPDPRSIAAAGRRGIVLRSVARKLDPSVDFERFDLIVPMDRANARDLSRHGCPERKMALCLGFVEDDELELARRHTFEVPDPYHGQDEDFDTVYRLVDSSARGLLRALQGGTSYP